MMGTQQDFLGHPKGLYVCFATEFWERFSFYGMKYLLLLYLTKYHLFTDSMGLDVLASYAALVYAMPVLGGLLADRYLGMRKAVSFGGLMLVLGHLGMAYEGHQAYRVGGEVVRDQQALNIFYLSLSLIVIGVGFLKPNISTIVGKLYEDSDPRRDSGFTIFYMGINMGALLATLLCGYLGEAYGWGYGFGAAGIGMAFGLIVFQAGQSHLKGYAEPPDPQRLQQKSAIGLSAEWTIYLAAIASLAVVWNIVQHSHLVEWLLNSMGLAVICGLLYFILRKCDAVERGRMLVMMVLIFSTVVFWALFEQSAASMTLFADRVTDRSLFGVDLTASQYGSFNSAFIILLAPLFASLWTFLGRRGWEPSIPVKFSLGIIFAGLGFGALLLGGGNVNEAGLVIGWWLVLAYLLHTIGELCLSPVGLSAVTKLSVPRVVGLMMGTWFLATAYSEFVAMQLSKIAAIDSAASETIDIASALASYNELFGFLFAVGIGVGIILLLISPVLKKHMHGIN
ncbi:MAG: peptide MFS transporter [Porticoccaceae bacterium]